MAHDPAHQSESGERKSIAMKIGVLFIREEIEEIFDIFRRVLLASRGFAIHICSDIHDIRHHLHHRSSECFYLSDIGHERVIISLASLIHIEIDTRGTEPIGINILWRGIYGSCGYDILGSDCTIETIADDSWTIDFLGIGRECRGRESAAFYILEFFIF